MQVAAQQIDVTDIKPHPMAPKGRAGQIRRLKAENPNLSHSQIAELTHTDPSNVTRVLQRFSMQTQEVDDYKSFRADILAGLQHRLMSHVTDAKLQKTPVGSLVLAACQLYDKERLERGQSTSNVDVHSVNEQIDEVRKRKAMLSARLDKLRSKA